MRVSLCQFDMKISELEKENSFSYRCTRLDDTSKVVGRGVGEVWVDMLVQVVDSPGICVNDLVHVLGTDFVLHPC